MLWSGMKWLIVDLRSLTLALVIVCVRHGDEDNNKGLTGVLGD